MRVGNTSSSSITLRTEDPQGFILNLCTSDCVATSSSNRLVKFADNTEVENLTSWSQTTSSYCWKYKGTGWTGLLQDADHGLQPHHHQWDSSVRSFRYLDVHVTEDLSLTNLTDSITVKVQQCLNFLQAGSGTPHSCLGHGQHQEPSGWEHYAMVWQSHLAGYSVQPCVSHSAPYLPHRTFTNSSVKPGQGRASSPERSRC